MKYRVEDSVFETMHEAVDYCISDSWHDDDEYFEEWVNDRESGIEINGTYYNAYEIVCAFEDGNWSDLKEQFCESMNDSDREEALYELRHAEAGESVDCQGYTIYVISDTEDCDSDDCIDNVRQYVEDRKIVEKEEKEKNKQNEDELIKLFQVIGG